MDAAGPGSPVQTTRWTSPSGVGLAIHDWGGEGPPTLLAHPTGFHGRSWAPVARRLVAAGRRVWSLDFRGHGDSDPAPDGHYDWRGFADDALGVTRHLGIAGAPDLLGVGHSKGGAALLLAEAGAPGTYSRLWCFEPIVFPGEPSPTPHDEHPLAVGARRRRDVWGSRDEAFAAYSSKPPLGALDPEALRAYVDYGFADQPDGTIALKCRPEHEASVYSMGALSGIWHSLGEVRVPVVVACGEHTDAITPRVATAIAAELPAGRVEVMEGLGHFGPMEDPTRVTASILAFAGEA